MKIPWKGKLATHSSILAWEIQWTEEPGRLQSKGSQRVDLELLKHNFSGFWIFFNELPTYKWDKRDMTISSP